MTYYHNLRGDFHNLFRIDSYKEEDVDWLFNDLKSQLTLNNNKYFTINYVDQLIQDLNVYYKINARKSEDIPWPHVDLFLFVFYHGTVPCILDQSAIFMSNRLKNKDFVMHQEITSACELMYHILNNTINDYIPAQIANDLYYSFLRKEYFHMIKLLSDMEQDYNITKAVSDESFNLKIKTLFTRLIDQPTIFKHVNSINLFDTLARANIQKWLDSNILIP